ncbi:DUF285 domain-containing protein [Vibrio parahaemolyticus]|nr:DUF285 domain-containing protein [Vibrio parahaemolyticus]
MNISKEILSGKKPVNQHELRHLAKYHEDYDLTKLDVSQISDFYGIFADCKTFNQDISNWDVSNGEDFGGMFFGARNFNQDISNWDVSKGADFEGMFEDAVSFNCDLKKWRIRNDAETGFMFADTNFCLSKTPETLVFSIGVIGEHVSMAAVDVEIFQKKVSYDDSVVCRIGIVDMDYLKMGYKEAGVIPMGFDFSGEECSIFGVKDNLFIVSDNKVAFIEQIKAQSFFNELKESGLVSKPTCDYCYLNDFVEEKIDKRKNVEIEKALNCLKAKEEKPVVESVEENKRKSRSKYIP